MAGELKVRFDASLNKNGLKSGIGDINNTLAFDVAGSNYASGTQVVDNTGEAINVGDAGTTGLIYIKNLSSSLSVELLSATESDPFAELGPGQIGFFPRKGAIKAKCTTVANCTIEVWASAA